MTKLYVDVVTTSENHGGYDPDISWSRDSTSSSHTLYDVYDSEHSRSYYLEEVPVNFEPSKGDIVYVLHAQWSTGDSFGFDNGYGHEVIAIYTDKDMAWRDKDKLEAGSGSVDLEAGFPWYIPWNGYFESLDWIKIEERVVE